MRMNDAFLDMRAANCPVAQVNNGLDIKETWLKSLIVAKPAGLGKDNQVPWRSVGKI